jgi:phytoene/squalene synthetase
MADAKSNSLERSLAEVHAKLADAPRLDGHSRKLLGEVLHDIERQLRARAPPHIAPPDPTKHRLEALAVEFEADHPALAASVRQFIDLLGRAGL